MQRGCSGFSGSIAVQHYSTKWKPSNFMLQPEPRVSFKTFSQTGADVDYTDTNCNFPLLFAVARGDADMVRLLCDAGVATDQVTDTVAKGRGKSLPPAPRP